MKNDEKVDRRDEKICLDDENEEVASTDVEKRQNSDKNRTFSDVFQLKNQFLEGCSPTTRPSEECRKRKISKRIFREKETGKPKEVLIAGGDREYETTNAMMSSPGKRKLDSLLSKVKTNSVRELIENFEVGPQNKRKKFGRESSCTRNQPHKFFNFGGGNK